MMAWRRNAYLSCVRGQRCLAAPLLSWKLFACRTGCSELPKHNTQLCMSGLDAAAFMSHLFPCCREPSWKSLSQRASLGLFNFLHKCGGDCYIPPTHSFPFPLCTSSFVPECVGLSHEAGLSTGIYEQRNKLEPSD